jgi:hypothetical protein
MPYVLRDATGRISAMLRESDSPRTEFLPDEDAEVLAFLGWGKAPTEDADFVRVIEDVIDALIVKNVINITDLPSGAQIKLMNRRSFRERVSQSSLRLFDGGGEGDVV